MKSTVALIFGGEGCEHGISILSAENLASMIDAKLYTIIYIYISEEGNWYIFERESGDSLSECEKGRLTPTYPVYLGGKSGFISGNGIISVDVAIPSLHGDFGEDGVIAGALSAAHIKYIGQDSYAAAFASDKLIGKLACRELSIPTARWVCCCGKEEAEKHLSYPMFIKPRRLGSSIGAHPVFCETDFNDALNNALAYSDSLIIEEYISYAYEAECAFFENGEKLFAPYGKILSSKFYDFSAKYESNTVKTDTARGISPDVENKIRNYSEKLVDFLGLRRLSRLDFFVTDGGDVYFNEINSFPGMTKNSLYPSLCESMGQTRGEFINLLIAGVLNDRSF